MSSIASVQQRLVAAKDRRIAALEAENARLRLALSPFSDMAGEMFARNWNKDDLAIALDNPDDPHRLFFKDFLFARAALKGETG